MLLSTFNVASIFIGFCAITSGSAWERHHRNITDEEALERAYQVLSQYPLVDGHNDLPGQYRSRRQCRVDSIDLSRDVNSQWGPSHTDIPRLRQGMVGSQFWAVFVGCSKQYKDAVRQTLEQIDVVKRFTEKYPDHFTPVTSAQGILDAFTEGKIGCLMGIEGGHSIDNSLGTIRMMYQMGVRYMSLTHNCNTPWADYQSMTINPEFNGLTEWGKLVVQEMNRLGMLVDLSHVAHQTMEAALNISRAPVMFSHSNAYTLCNHFRNVPDHVLQRIRATGGIVMVTFVGGFLNCFPSDDRPNDVAIVADHIEYIETLIGADYVGIGGDYDGASGLPEGLKDVSEYPNLFAELIKRGWSDENLEKLAGRNIVRVFQRVEEVRDEMKNEGVRPFDTWIPQEDITNRTVCRT